jgi:hypothetical protein
MEQVIFSFFFKPNIISLIKKERRVQGILQSNTKDKSESSAQKWNVLCELKDQIHTR